MISQDTARPGPSDASATAGAGGPAPTSTPGEPSPPRRAAHRGSRRPALSVVTLVGALVLGLVAVAAVRGLREHRASELREARSAVGQMLDEATRAQEALREQVAAGEELLAASEGHVADDAGRVALTVALDAAAPFREAVPPAVPAPGTDEETLDGLREAADEVSAWAGQVALATRDLVAGVGRVRASQEAWQLARSVAALDAATARLDGSVEGAGWTLRWADRAGAPDDARASLAAAIDSGEARLGEAVDRIDREAVDAAVSTLTATRDELERAAWSARDTLATGGNGRYDRSELCSLGLNQDAQEQFLRCGAAEAWGRMSEEFAEEFGHPIPVEFAYRPYDVQLWAFAEYGAGRAAEPATSQHGWGAAVDLPEYGEYDYGQPKREWIAANGPRFGWDAPGWAQEDGGREEPWHFEFTG
ncbi:D-alanyl-D-alanine carboxypeptidase family protein [Antribacter sp. KLBMP9083]|uniref:D-alanyl-D-alanine carboxypeptidase family protein n=1 Tax=Antribacter soli TaxID=2910976 RepID=A0AA41QBR3_9MICO|nr:D-alanyl-D-alanine carboxypeptidase family protein [Antribacter soli]MCF4120514.1 D-alanyl-D-alanine carboxypeptidase family protein [Antribacter soli]